MVGVCVEARDGQRDSRLSQGCQRMVTFGRLLGENPKP
jgi:hypothetical protein